MADTPELSRKTIQSWRNFAMSDEYRIGLAFLERFHAPSVNTTSVPDMVNSTIQRAGYLSALTDLTDVLQAFAKKDETLDEPSLS